MLNEEILNEIQKLKEVNYWTQNRLSNLETKLIKNNQNNINFNKSNENFDMNGHYSDFPCKIKSKGLETANIQALETENHVFKFTDYEMLDELYERSKNHLKIFQKKCDNLLKPVNSKRKNDFDEKKNDRLYQKYLSHYLGKSDCMNNKMNYQKNCLYQSNNAFQSNNINYASNINYSSDDSITDDSDIGTSSTFSFTNQYEKNPHSNRHFKPEKRFNSVDNMNSNELFKKIHMDINGSELTNDCSYLSSSMESNHNSLVDSNMSDTYNDSDNFESFKSLYLKGQKVQNFPSNIPYQYQYQNNANGDIFNSQRIQASCTNKKSHKQLSNDSTSFNYSTLSTASSLLNVE